tara:strand:+ start:177 stop:434 length:258 start_codon:yes stop_codon:yes gene_type:complete
LSTIADIATTPQNAARVAFWIKWIASIFQIVGYGATAFGWTPWNIYMFLVGLIGWFTVGMIWRDRAIILIHVIALCAMTEGLIGS